MKRASLAVVASLLSLLLFVSMLPITMIRVDAATPLGCLVQTEAKWENVYVGRGSLAATGCGIFSLSNAVGYLTGKRMNVVEVAQWAYEIGAFNKTGAEGTYRYELYPQVNGRYGRTYEIAVDCGNNGRDYAEGSGSSTLKNHLANGGVAVGHVPGHFIALVDYDAYTNEYHVYDSAPSTERGTNRNGGDVWLTPAELAAGKMLLDWFCLISSTAATTQPSYTEWLEELPAYVTEDFFDIESKTVYRYRDNASHVVYGEWSAEMSTSTKPTESDTLAIVSTTTYYNYYHYCCNYYNGKNNVDSIPYGSGPHYYHTIRLTSALSPTTVADRGGQTLYGSCACEKGFRVWARAEQYITRGYKYKTRTATDVVDYGDWTDWSKTEPSAATNRDVESKTFYRHKPNHDHTWSDAGCDAPKTCTICGATEGDTLPHAYDNDYDATCDECGHVREVEISTTFEGNSVSEDVSGLAFRFDVACEGMQQDVTTAIYDNATVNGYKLLSMGAVITNGVGSVDIPAVYLWDLQEDVASYVVRLVHIPDNQYDRTITATPYIVLEIDGVATTIYGEAQTCSYNEAMN